MTTSAETTALETELNPKTRLEGKVVKTTLAGAIIDIGKEVPGIIHISQLQETPVKRVEDVVQVGQTVTVWVKRAKADRVELTLIEPVGLDWKEIKPEMTLKGKVVRLETYGAFVEIGAERPGLVHISEMAHGFVKTPQEVAKEGDEVEVVVLDVDRKKKQIRLSMKAAQPKPEEPAQEEMARPERTNKTARPKKPSKPRGERSERFEMPSEPAEVEPTVFELAWQAALERSKAQKADKSKKSRISADERENILDRTLKTRLPTGG